MDTGSEKTGTQKKVEKGNTVRTSVFIFFTKWEIGLVQISFTDFLSQR